MNRIDCERPASGRSPYTTTNFRSRKMVVPLTDGTVINAIYPLARLVRDINLQTDADLTSLSLSSSLINGTASDVVGVFVGLARNTVINLDEVSDFFLCHLSLQNSVPGVPVASSRSNAVAFGEETAYRLRSGARFAIYACSSNTVDNQIAASLDIYWQPVR